MANIGRVAGHASRQVNKTQLSPDREFERNIFHRDQFAHYLRWSFILKQCRPRSAGFGGERILDVGCGSANLAEVLYRNRYKPEMYHGIDIRKAVVESNSQIKYNFPTTFEYLDMRKNAPKSNNYTKICCFEVIEHFERQYADDFLLNIKSVMEKDTLLYLSTPCFNGGKAANHIHEYGYEELKKILLVYFNIKHVYGTFASKKDLFNENGMNDMHKKVYDELSEYYDSNVMSVIFAPLYPTNSRNCMWILEKKSASDAPSAKDG